MPKYKINWYDHHKMIFDPLNIALSPGDEILAIGDIHEQGSLFDKFIQKIEKYHFTVKMSVGDIYDKGDGREVGNKIYNQLIKNSFHILMGNHEIKKVRKKDAGCNWQNLQNLPFCLSFCYPESRYTGLHGGVTPSMSWNHIKYDDSILYIRDIDPESHKMIKLIWKNEELMPEKSGGVNWHDLYDGRLGYIISGHQAQEDGKAKFYKYSCNLDSGAYKTGVLTAAIFNQNGLKDILEIK